MRAGERSILSRNPRSLTPTLSPTGRGSAPSSLQVRGSIPPQHVCRSRPRSLSFGAERDEVSRAGAAADHERVIGVFRHLPPQVFLVAECHQVLVDLLEVGIL